VAAGQGRTAAAADGPERARLDEALTAARAALEAATSETERLAPRAEALPSRATEPAS
jgi:hypothetical protein